MSRRLALEHVDAITPFSVQFVHVPYDIEAESAIAAQMGMPVSMAMRVAIVKARIDEAGTAAPQLRGHGGGRLGHGSRSG